MVLLQAGLEGIEHGYELPDPMEKNLYHLSPRDERRRAGDRPAAGDVLGEAIELTAESELVLRTLGEHMFNPLHRDQAPGVGRLLRSGHALGARALPAGLVMCGRRTALGRSER